MCFRRIRPKKNKIKKKKIYPQVNYQNVTTEEFIKECISCHHCKQIFNLESNEIKIHCAGCNQFYHCGIAGKCNGNNCNMDTLLGTNHKLSWCIHCVPKLPINGEKVNGIGNCMCPDCYKSIN